MNTLRLNYRKIDFEKVMITLGMAFMEITGVVLLLCGLLEVRIF